MEISRKNIAYFFLAVSVLATVLYLFFFRSLVSEAYHNNAPSWFSNLISLAYPRFEVEKQRFELAFFQYKADQIVLRFCLVAVSLSILLLSLSYQKLIKKYSISRSQGHFRMLRYLFYLGLLIYTWDWYLDFEQIVRMQAFYKGVHLFRLLGVKPLALPVFYLLFGIYLFSVLLVLLDVKKIWFSALAALLFIFFQGYFFSFEKIEHSYTTLTYSAMLMPFLFYELETQNKTKGKLTSFVLLLIQLCISGVYLLAGIEKLLTSGFSWAGAETFRTYVYLHEQPLGLMIAESDFFAHFLPWGALIFQLVFILILFLPTYKLFFLMGGISFHWGTRLLMGIGSFFSPWIFVYIFFLNFEKITSILPSRITNIIKVKKGI